MFAHISGSSLLARYVEGDKWAPGNLSGLPLTAPRTERGWAETGFGGLKLVLPQCPPRNQQRPACFRRRFPAAQTPG